MATPTEHSTPSFSPGFHYDYESFGGLGTLATAATRASYCATMHTSHHALRDGDTFAIFSSI